MAGSELARDQGGFRKVQGGQALDQSLSSSSASRAKKEKVRRCCSDEGAAGPEGQRVQTAAPRLSTGEVECAHMPSRKPQSSGSVSAPEAIRAAALGMKAGGCSANWPCIARSDVGRSGRSRARSEGRGAILLGGRVARSPGSIGRAGRERRARALGASVLQADPTDPPICMQSTRDRKKDPKNRMYNSFSVFYLCDDRIDRIHRTSHHA